MRSRAGHLAWPAEQLGERFLAGVVLHTGPHVYRLTEKIIAAPIAVLWGRTPTSKPAPMRPAEGGGNVAPRGAKKTLYVGTKLGHMRMMEWPFAQLGLAIDAGPSGSADVDNGILFGVNGILPGS